MRREPLSATGGAPLLSPEHDPPDGAERSGRDGMRARCAGRSGMPIDCYRADAVLMPISKQKDRSPDLRKAADRPSTAHVARIASSLLNAGQERGSRLRNTRVLVGFALCLMSTACGGGPQCAPFARSLTGLRLSGSAAGWWRQSAGRYAHSRTPEPGAVLVLQATHRLPYGHVSVVRRVLDPREILVTHANWEPGEIDRNVLVLDVSALNDWSLVRVWWRPSNRIGRARFAAFGFILPEPPASLR